MGIIRMGPPEDLLIQIAESFQVKYFIETGTYYGGTAVWAAQHFPRVATIEYSQALYEQAVAKHSEIKNIEFRFGDSRTQLEQLAANLNESAIFWLDAHWSDSFTYGENDQCPLLDEIRVINQSPHDHFLFIDDARLFTSPPQPQHNPEQWPDITTVIQALAKNHYDSSRYIVIVEDVIIAVPLKAKSLLVDYCQATNAVIWANFLEQSALSDFDKAMQLLNRGSTTGSRSVSFLILKHLYLRLRKNRRQDA
jgi:hypothetical protein